MFRSFLKPEISKTEDIIELEPPPLNTLIPRLIPKVLPKKGSSKNYFKKEFISRKRKHSNKKEKSKPEENTFNSQNNFKYINYFIGESQENINNNHKKFHHNNSSKCFICGKPGHHGAECKEKKEEICPKCLGKNHLNNVCPYEICLNCGKRGHKQQNCFYFKKNKNKYKKNLKKCFNCSNYGHESNECLSKPNPIYIKNYSKIPLCAFCKSSNHYICPFNKNKGIFVIPVHYYDDNGYNDKNNSDSDFNLNNNEIVNRNNSESLLNYFLNEIKKNEKIELKLGELPQDITKEEIKNTNFCCKCGNNHFSDDCEKFKKKNKFNLNNDYIFNLKDNIIHRKNPLKFETYERKEYTINHHDIRADYYDQSDSSGESFNELFKKNNN